MIKYVVIMISMTIWSKSPTFSLASSQAFHAGGCVSSHTGDGGVGHSGVGWQGHPIVHCYCTRVGFVQRVAIRKENAIHFFHLQLPDLANLSHGSPACRLPKVSPAGEYM